MDEKKYKLINIIFNSIIYLIFTLWLFLAISNNMFNTKYKNLETKLFIFGSFFWIVLGIILLQKEYKEYYNN
jgi:hypothetical protein